MRSWINLTVAVVLCAAMVGCGRKKVGKWDGLASPRTLAGAGLNYYWDLRLPLERDEKIVRLDLLDENLYCLTNYNRLMALDAARGTWKWTYQVGSKGQRVFRPVHAEDVILSRAPSSIAEIAFGETPAFKEPFDAVLINTLSYVLVLDHASGKLIRKIEFDFAANSGGASDGEAFFVASTDGRFCSILLQEAVRIWTLGTNGSVVAPLEYHNGKIYVGGQNNTFYAADVGRLGHHAWKESTYGPITAGFQVNERGCFVPCEDNRLYAFSPASGRALWDQGPFVCQGPLRDAVQVAERTIFQYAQGDSFYAINLSSGDQRWSLPTGRLVLSIVDGQVYLLDNLNQLNVVDEITGAGIKTVSMTGYDVFVGNTVVPALYAATGDGLVVCLRREDAGYLKPDMLKPGS